MWAFGSHVSSQAPALASVLLGDVEGEGAEGGVALSPAAVASVLGAVIGAMARSAMARSSSGSYIWSAMPTPQPFTSTPHAGVLIPTLPAGLCNMLCNDQRAQAVCKEPRDSKCPADYSCRHVL